ncbi:MAG: ABC transporter ATP-binding protein [Bilifractor sp.]|jgi:ATP-binding cassette subfamily B protein
MKSEQRKANRSTLHWISSVAGKKKVNLIWLTVLQIVLGVSNIITALILGWVIDSAVAKDLPGFIRNAVELIILMLLIVAASAVNRYLIEYVKSDMENCFKGRLFQTILTRDYAHISSVHSGEWMNRLTSDTEIVANGVSTIIPNVIGMLVRIVGALVLIIRMMPFTGWILLPAGVAFIILTYIFRKKLKSLHKKVREANGRLRVFLSESIRSLMMVKTYVQEKHFEAEAQKKMDEHRKARMEKNHFSNICNIGFGLGMDSAYFIGAIYCGYQILMGRMSYGSFTSVLQLIGQIQSPVANITGYLPTYYATLASAERLMEAETLPESDPDQVLSFQEVTDFYQHKFAGLRLEHVDFTYLPPVLDSADQDKSTMPIVIQDLNLVIPKGSYVALTGTSGCGKSTIMKLLMCLYPLDAGERKILLSSKGEIPLTDQYRRLYAYVPQGNQLMTGTIRDIITFGENDSSQHDEKIWSALRIACAEDFVRKLEDGLETMLGERGAGLSEGQMQRIAIARAIYSDNPILMLDESTSALDEVTEKKLLSNLKEMTDKTVIIVTHRLSVLSICTEQIVMEPSGITIKPLNSVTSVSPVLC